MKYFKVVKSKKKKKLEKKIDFKNGYSFKNKMTITTYNPNVTRSILNQKIESTLGNILKKLIILEEDDEDGVAEITIRIETLRNLLLEKYFPYIGKTQVKYYLLKLQEIGNKLPKKTAKKSRSK